MQNNELYNIPENILYSIYSMSEYDTFSEQFLYYNTHMSDLKDCSFFCFSKIEGNDLPEYIQTNYENDFAIINIGYGEKYYAINKSICEEMIHNGISKYNMDLCVELDTQAVSYMKKYFSTPENIQLPDKMKNFFEYLYRDDVNFSCLPYMIENANRVTSSNFIDLYQNLYSYQLMKKLNYIAYSENNEVKYNDTYESIRIETDGLFHQMQSPMFKKSMSGFYDMQETIYCLLIKAVYIELSNSKKSSKNKLKLLFDFVNDEFGVFTEREMAICYYYFSHKDETKRFFKKINKDSKKILNTINGMAWDLTHVRSLERMIDFRPDETTQYGMHALLTYDKGLIDILKLYPVKMYAIYKGRVVTLFKRSFIDEVPEFMEYFSDKNKLHRQKTYQAVNIQQLKKNLERELSSICVNA